MIHTPATVVTIDGYGMRSFPAPRSLSNKEFPASTEAVLGREGWESVADFALDWALAHADVSSPTAT